MESILCRKVFNISGEILSSLVKTLLLHSSSGESLGDTSWQSIGHKRVGQIFTCYFPVKNINSFFDRLCGLKRALFSWCFNPKGIFSVEIWICWPDNALALISIFAFSTAQYVVHDRERLKVQKELSRITSSKSEVISEDEAEERKIAIGKLEADLEAANQGLQSSKNQEKELGYLFWTRRLLLLRVKV